MKLKNLSPLLLLFILSFSTCKEDEGIKPSDVSQTLIVGQWHIAYFFDSDHEATSEFTGYNFIFTKTAVDPIGGLVEASNGSTDVVGTWSTNYSGDNAQLNLEFSINPFDELNEDWRITERTSEKITLIHESGGGGGTDHLTLEKN